MTSPDPKAVKQTVPDPNPRVDHGSPWYFNCTVPGCTLDGHKCYRKGCPDRLHTHPDQQAGS
jgi:hypothetical protein